MVSFWYACETFPSAQVQGIAAQLSDCPSVIPGWKEFVTLQCNVYPACRHLTGGAGEMPYWDSSPALHLC